MKRVTILTKTTMHAVATAQRDGWLGAFFFAGLFLLLLWYAVLVNGAAGIEFRLKELSAGLSKIESELAKNQAALILQSFPRAPEESAETGLLSVGNDLSYLHANAVFVDASRPRP